MIENLTFWQKVRIWLSELSFMRKPLALFDETANKMQDFTQRLKDAVNDYAIYLRYIIWLFILTIAFVILKAIYKWIIARLRVSFFDFSENMRSHFWDRYTETEEKQNLSAVKEVFNLARKNKQKPSLQNVIGFDLFRQIMAAIGEGMSDAEIVKLLPSTVGMIDVLPIIESVRFFRDFAAQRILQNQSREKRDYLLALREMSEGRPYRAVQLMRKELVFQQKMLFSLKDRFLQQYTKKEASRLSLYVALIIGIYDVTLADKAYQRAMELNPKNKTASILFGRFRQRVFGANDKVAEKVFMGLTKGIDKTLKNYMVDYAVQMVRKTQMRARLNELRSRYQDEKERYNAAIQIERLKLREQLMMHRMKLLAEEAKVHSSR